jgi:hypothetical protein
MQYEEVHGALRESLELATVAVKLLSAHQTPLPWHITGRVFCSGDVDRTGLHPVHGPGINTSPGRVWPAFLWHLLRPWVHESPCNASRTGIAAGYSRKFWLSC